jgi:hypothetical protein
MIFLKIFFGVWLKRKNQGIKRNPATVARIQQRSTSVSRFWPNWAESCIPKSKQKGRNPAILAEFLPYWSDSGYFGWNQAKSSDSIGI